MGDVSREWGVSSPTRQTPERPKVKRSGTSLKHNARSPYQLKPHLPLSGQPKQYQMQGLDFENRNLNCINTAVDTHFYMLIKFYRTPIKENRMIVDEKFPPELTHFFMQRL